MRLTPSQPNSSRAPIVLTALDSPPRAKPTLTPTTSKRKRDSSTRKIPSQVPPIKLSSSTLHNFKTQIFVDLAGSLSRTLNRASVVATSTPTRASTGLAACTTVKHSTRRRTRSLIGPRCSSETEIVSYVKQGGTGQRY